MANLRDIRRRIKSVKNTAQITKAMQLVAAAKMKKAQMQATVGRAYADQMNRVLIHLKSHVSEETHPMLAQRAGGRTLMLVISTDKGLCGGLNTNLLRKVRLNSDSQTAYVTVGRKLRGQLAKTQSNLLADFIIKDPVHFVEARPIGKFLVEQFLSGKYDTIKVAFTNFISTISQEPWVSTLLPIDPEKLAERRGYEQHETLVDREELLAKDYIFEPDPEAVFDALLPQYINYQVYQMMLEARASEHSSRMVAMKAATDNAKEMIDDLSLEYNKMRQAAITSELLEITTAMKAME